VGSGLDKDELNGKRLTSTFVPLPPISSTFRSIGLTNNTGNSIAENTLNEELEDYPLNNYVYDDIVAANNPLFDADYDEKLDENQEFIAAEVNPDQDRTLNKLLHQEQLSVPQRDEEIVLTDGGASHPQEIGKPENLTASKTNSNSTVLT
jgi:hypothetical protein